MNRRRFLSTAAGAAGLVALGGCGDGVVTGPFAELPAGPIAITVAEYPALATIDRLVKVVAQPIAVKRTGAATFDAISMNCTHEGCLTNIVSNAFSCPCHGSAFANDGGVTQGPANAPLPKFITSYDPATDVLTIT